MKTKTAAQGTRSSRPSPDLPRSTRVSSRRSPGRAWTSTPSWTSILPAARIRRPDALADHRGHDPGPELHQLEDAPRGEVGAAEAGREADEVLDPGGAAGLPAGAEAVEQESREALRCRVDRRGDPRGAGAD